MQEGESANVARFLASRAREQPDACAVKAPIGRDSRGNIRYEEISFAQLEAQTDQLAHALAGKGIGRGTRVLLLVRPGSDLIRCCFALFKAGAVPVVIDPGMGLRHFLKCVERTRPEAIVGVPLALAISRTFRRAFSSVSQRISVGRGFSSWYAKHSLDPFPIAEPSPDELAAILFTSGSTGPPKGVRYGHGQFDAQVRLIRETFQIGAGETDLPMLPVFALFNPALGMTTVVPEINPAKPARANPEKLLRAIRQESVTNSFGSPVLWRKLALHARATGQTFPSLRRILMAGAPVPPGLVRIMQPVFPNAVLWSPYGATECLPVSCIDGRTILEESAEKTIRGAGTCVGYPVAGVSLRIIPIHQGPVESMETAGTVDTGEIGEIVATGPSVTQSYDGLPEATRLAKIIDRDGVVWHRMGDAGYIDPDGRLWFCGRIAERVLTPQGPLYTDCCEGIFNNIPGVRRSALIGLGKAPGQEAAIVIEPDPNEVASAGQIREVAGNHALTKNIRKVFFCKSFPVDVRHNAKIHRLTLARRFAGK